MYLEHSWGKKPEQKAREKEYNHEYYLRNKDKWIKDRTPGTIRDTADEYRSRAFLNGYDAGLADLGFSKSKTTDEASKYLNEYIKNVLEGQYNTSVSERLNNYADERDRQKEKDIEARKQEARNHTRRETESTRRNLAYKEHPNNYKQDLTRTTLLAEDAFRKEINAGKDAVQAIQKYYKTPLGRLEQLQNTINTGAEYIANLFKKKK